MSKAFTQEQDADLLFYQNGLLKAEVKRLRSQIPDTMPACTILFKECEVGHGWLTADNWVQHECKQCEIKSLTKEVEALKAEQVKHLRNL